MSHNLVREGFLQKSLTASTNSSRSHWKDSLDGEYLHGLLALVKHWRSPLMIEGMAQIRLLGLTP